MKKQLYRIEGEKTILGGVCLGLSEYFNIDLTLVRTLFVILFFTPVPIFTIYVIMWAVLPKYSPNFAYSNAFDVQINDSEMSKKQKNDNFVGGVILIIVGTIFAFKTLFGIQLFSYIGKLWPLIPIGIGIWLITKDKIQGDSQVNNELPDARDNDSSEITKY